MSQQKILSQIYLFKELTPQELDLMAQVCKEKSVSAGADIFISGQKAESFFVVKYGSVKIYATTKAGDDINISNMSTGAHFGEMPFLDGATRSATSQALEQSTLIEIPYKDFENLLNQQPAMSVKVHRAFARHLCQRLRVTTEDFSKIREFQLKS